MKNLISENREHSLGNYSMFPKRNMVGIVGEMEALVLISSITGVSKEGNQLLRI
jgi:hypothetical protein